MAPLFSFLFRLTPQHFLTMRKSSSDKAWFVLRPQNTPRGWDERSRRWLGVSQTTWEAKEKKKVAVAKMATTEEELFSSEERQQKGNNNAVLPRSRSLPHLSHHDSGLGSYYGVGLWLLWMISKCSVWED